MIARPQRRLVQQGFSLVEVMVAMMIGLITVVAILQTLSVADAQRRSVTSGADANVNGALALQLVQRDIFNAGYGIALDKDLFSLCRGRNVLAYNADRSPAEIVLSPSDFSPVVINPPGIPAGDPNTDVLQITYSGSDSFVSKGIGITSPAAAASVYSVTSGSRAGFHAGDLAIAVQDDEDGDGVSDADCVVAQITQVPNGAGNPDECGENGGGTDKNLVHNAGTFRNSYRACTPQAARWNKPGGLGVHIANGKLYSLGSPERFVVRAYAIRNGRLTVCNPMLADCDDLTRWEVAGDGIVSLRAQYGYDADNNGVSAAEWVRDLGAVPAPLVWARLKAVRLVMVARGAHFEREVVSDDCTPDWAGQSRDNRNCSDPAAAGEIFLRSAPDGANNWNRYRYKVFQTTAQTRNLYWSNNLD